MKVTVVVPTYNRPDALVKVIEGLLHQTRLPDEIIIADDGSKDETKRKILKYLAHKSVRIKHVWQEDKGFRAARIRNKAIIRSTGDYIVLLDGDCIPEKHFIEDHTDLAREGCFFQGKRVLVNEQAADAFDYRDCNTMSRRITLSAKGDLANRHHILRVPMWPSRTTKKLSGAKSCNMGFFKTDLVAVNGFNHAFEGWGREDSELVVRLFKYGLLRRENRFRAICYHLWHPENDRAGLTNNDRLLKEVIQVPSYQCNNGLNELV
mgnify:CR=1 FL=1